MDINNLTIGQAKELAAMFGATQAQPSASLNGMIGKPVIVRTYTAGVWFGVLAEKSGNEVILTGARRMYRWWAAESISLSAVAIYGINEAKSKIIEPITSVWLEAIEIMPTSDKATAQIAGAKHVKAE